MKRNTICGFMLCVIGSLCTSGCNATPNSHIVAKVTAAGFGNPEKMDTFSLQYWLATHDQLVAEIAPDCRFAMLTAKPGWAQTTEGRVCAAARQVLSYKRKPISF